MVTPKKVLTCEVKWEFDLFKPFVWIDSTNKSKNSFTKIFVSLTRKLPSDIITMLAMTLCKGRNQQGKYWKPNQKNAIIIFLFLL